MTTTKRIKENDLLVHQWFDLDDDKSGWIRFLDDSDTGPVLADTRTKEDGDDIVYVCNKSIEMAKLLERAEGLFSWLVTRMDDDPSKEWLEDFKKFQETR